MQHDEWVWSDTLKTNQETIDYQHRSLFRTINDLIRACNQSPEASGLLVEVALDELLKYASYHFSEEEEVMRKHNYTGLNAHHAEHVSFASQMLEFKKRFDRNENVADELITFMHRWLVNHIMTRDKEAMAHCID